MSGLPGNATEWAKIGASKTVIKWITDGVPVIFDKIPDPCFHKNHYMTDAQCAFVDEKLSELKNTGAVEVLDYKPHCVSALGVRPKKNKKNRLIHDLSYLNEHCITSGFQYEDIRTVKKCIRSGDQMFTIDLKDGFHHVPILPNFRDYFGFQWRGVYYRWAVLPFGWCNSPYFFGKVLKPVVTFLRSQGIRIVLYVDDFLGLVRPEVSIGQQQFVIDTLIALGWKINYEKSDLTLSYRKLFVGYIIDTHDEPLLEVPKDKVKKLQKDIRRALARPCISARVLARIAGLCISVVRAVGPGKLMLRGVYRLLSTRAHWGESLVFSSDAVSDLQWWLDELEHWNGLVLNIAVPDAQIITDASPWGYGAVYDSLKASGFWTRSVSSRCQNYREMMAVLVAIEIFSELLRHKHVQIVTDNMSAVAYINSGGGPSRQLTLLARAIFFKAARLKACVSATWRAGSAIAHVDYLSRLSPKYEWSLSDDAFQMLEVMWGPHQVDRFASATNAKLPLFNSRYWEPGSLGVDALAQDWSKENNYVNAPFRLLDAVVEKISRCKAIATVIAPYWPSQPWFHCLRSMLVAPPLRIPLKAVRSAWPMAEVVKNSHWRIYAWRVSGNRR